MNSTVISEFRATGGKAGGVFSGKPLVLLHHIGAKSGTERISPLVPLLYDGRIFASDPDPDARAVRDFNEYALADDRVELALLSVGDGLIFARKK